jgi:hypothetical protein
MEQSCELAVGVKCGILKTAVLCLCIRYATRHGIGPGLEMSPSVPVTRSIPPRMGSHPGVRSATWCPAWSTRSVHMGLTLAHPAHSRSALTRACEEGARAQECALRAAT